MLFWARLKHPEVGMDVHSDDIDQNRRLAISRGAMLAGGAAALAFAREAKAAEPLSYFQLTGWYNAKADFGVVGDNTIDDTAALQNAIDQASNVQRPLFLPPGTYRISQPLQVRKNTILLGSGHGRGFSSILAPNNCPALLIGGATQIFHALLENFTIQPIGAAPQPYLIRVDNCYSITVRNVRIHNAVLIQSPTAPNDAPATTGAIVLYGSPAVGGNGRCNDVLWDNVLVRNISAQPVAAAVLALSGCGSHRFRSPALENYRDLLSWQGGSLDILTPYGERCGRYGVDCNPDLADTTAHLNTFGGVITAPNSDAVACAIRSNARRFNSFGTSWENAGNFAAYVYSLAAVGTHLATFHGITNPIVSVNSPGRFAGVSGWERQIAFPDFALKGSAAWNGTVVVPANGQQAMAPITISGARLGRHWVRATSSSNLGPIQLSAHVSADNQVTVIAQNNSSASASLSGTVFVDLFWI
jgi:Pectate lyase superfamily protein